MASNKIDLFKFPRTKHLFDAGGSGVSRDDLLMDPGEERMFYSGRTQSSRKSGASSKGKKTSPSKSDNLTLVSIEEKVDGANLGISLDSDMQFLVQNRSHYINSKTHRQFAALDSWLTEHSAGLFDVLGEPGSHVLFGEWLYAKHSIHYTRLPGYFMAFDIFDVKKGRFYSWRERNRRLEGTGIPVVRQITETSLSGREDVLKLLETPSVFYDGPCEGIYLRIDEDDITPSPSDPEPPAGADHHPVPYARVRGKLVRPDFLQGIEEQWTRQQLTKNIVCY